MGQLVARGHELTPHPDHADVLVVNTCSFIDPAKKESVDTILEMAEYKKIGRAQKLIVAGCLVERYRGDIQKDLPEVDALIGTNELDSIVALCEGTATPSQSRRAVPLSRPHAARAGHARPLRLHQDRRRLRSSLHLLRDPAVSRQLPQPPLRIGDLRSHAPVPAGRARDQPDRAGHHLLRRRSRPERRPGASCWRGWRKSRRRTKSGSASSTPIRIRSRRSCSTPSRSITALVKYIDMPLQHASAPVLKRMKRGASGDIFLKLIERIRGTIPGVAIRTSFIVGFPGRDGRRFRDALPVREGRAVRPPGRVLLLRRRHQRQLSNSTAKWMPARSTTASARRWRFSARFRARAIADWSDAKCRFWWKAVAGNRPACGKAACRAGAGDRRRQLINDFEGDEPRPGEIRRLRITEAHDYDVVGTLLSGHDEVLRAATPN